MPVRVQHRSGALWVVNSAGLERLGDPSVKRGLLWRADAWLRARLGSRPPSLRAVGARLAAFGVTHVADATPDAGAAEVVAAAVRRGELPQHVLLMAADCGPADHPRLSVGPVKLVVADHAPPDFDELTTRIRRAHTAGRPVAVHCVTRVALALTLAALDEAGHMRGDRVEHGAVAGRPARRRLLGPRRTRGPPGPVAVRRSAAGRCPGGREQRRTVRGP